MTAATGLDADQRLAVEHRGGPCVVVAGPGAGKTRVLAHRAAALVAEGVPARRILLLTFTRASGRSMMERATAIDPACAELSGGTFHSLATRLVNQNAHLFGADRPFTVLDRDDSTEVVRRCVERLRTDDGNWPRPALVASVTSYAANTRLPMEEAVRRLAPSHLDEVDAFRAVRDAATAFRLERGLLSYDDSLEYLGALLADPEIGPAVRARWDHVMIDEYQDTNALQLDIVHGLAEDGGDVMVVGDPSQSIFGFRGSAPGTLRAFRDGFAGCRTVTLAANYRSTPSIVALVNRIDRRLDTGFERDLSSASGRTDTKPTLVRVEDELAQAREIVDAILAHKADGGAISDCAVVVRSMGWARTIEAEMTSRRVPYRVSGGIKIDETAHVKELLSLGRLAANHRFEPAWFRVLRRYRGVGDAAAGEMSQRLVSLATQEEVRAALAQEAARRGFDAGPLVDALGRLSRDDLSPATALSEAIALMEPLWSSVKEWADDWRERRRDFDAILLIARRHRTLDELLTAITLDASLDRRSADAQRPGEDPTTITTIHAAKGLEWDHVHLPSLVRGHIPAPYAEEPDEEMRLLYVAVSRARSTLSVYRPHLDRKGAIASPSPFEALIAPGMAVRSVAAPIGSHGPIGTGRRIDMRSRMLGRP